MEKKKRGTRVACESRTYFRSSLLSLSTTGNTSAVRRLAPGVCNGWSEQLCFQLLRVFTHRFYVLSETCKWQHLYLVGWTRIKLYNSVRELHASQVRNISFFINNCLQISSLRNFTVCFHREAPPRSLTPYPIMNVRQFAPDN